jgi:hypothetical protein
MYKLVLAGASFQVPRRDLLAKCQLFAQQNVRVLPSYQVSSSVSVDAFDSFLSEVQDKPAAVTQANASDLALLAREFGFAALSEKVDAFLADHPAERPPPETALLRDLARQVRAQERQIRDLQLELARLSRVEEEVAFLKRVLLRLTQSVFAAQPADPGLLADVSRLGAESPDSALPPPAADPAGLIRAERDLRGAFDRRVKSVAGLLGAQEARGRELQTLKESIDGMASDGDAVDQELDRLLSELGPQGTPK